MTRAYWRTDFSAVVLFLIAITSTVYAKEPASQPTMAPGTQINVRIKDKLSSNGAKVGDPFRGRLETPISANGNVLYPKGTEVAGYVVSSHPSGRANEPGILELDLISIGEGAKMSSVSATTLIMKGEVHKKSKGSTTAAIVVPDAKGKAETVVESDALLTWVVSPPRSLQDWSKKPGKVYQGSTGAFRIVGHDQPAEPKVAATPTYGFNDRDRRALRKCFATRRSGVSAGLMATQLPPATQKQLQKDKTLSPGLQKRVQPLPASCTQQLSPVPRKWTRGLVSDRIVLLDPGARIVDIFAL